jgi:two-component system, NarL family, sensor histidine kinase DesK
MKRRSSLGYWFQLISLVFLFFPIVGVFEQARIWYMYAFGILLIMAFVAVFVWAFWLEPRVKDPQNPSPFRPPSLVGMLVSYAVMALLWPLIGSSGIGFLIYAAAFAGVQRSPWPAVFAISACIAVCLALVLVEDLSWLTAAMFAILTLVAAVSNNLAYHETLSSRALQRSQEEVVRIAKVAERERIARDLHDLLGHTLSVIVLKSELASRLADKDPARAAQEIRDVERIARESLQEVRSAVRGYRSAGLEAEFSNVALACEAAKIKLELYVVPIDLEWAQESAMAFVLREAITNVVRHSRAQCCWVSLEEVDQQVRLEVWDDAQGEIFEGNGVRGIRERAEALGGSLVMQVSSGSRGLTFLLPLREATVPLAELPLTGLEQS